MVYAGEYVSCPEEMEITAPNELSKEFKPFLKHTKSKIISSYIKQENLRNLTTWIL